MLVKSKNFKIPILLLGVLIASWSPRSFAAHIYMRPYDSIQDTIDSASEGDVIHIPAGTYEEDIYMRYRVNIVGESRYRVTIKGRIFFFDARSYVYDVTLLYPEAARTTYSNEHYTDWEFNADSGVVAINSIPWIQGCIISPDLEAINTNRQAQGLEPVTHYGKGFSMINLYRNPVVAPFIRWNLFRNTKCAIYYFCQARAELIDGIITHNTFYDNEIGVYLRMHNEEPNVRNNVFSRCGDCVLYVTYKDGELFENRLYHFNNNLLFENTMEGWLDAEKREFAIGGNRDNIIGDPLFIDSESGVFYLSSDESPCIGAGSQGDDIGAYPVDREYPQISDVSPEGNVLVGTRSIQVSGDATDDNGIARVLVNSRPTEITGAHFIRRYHGLRYGLNDIFITATDVAQKDTIHLKQIYLYRAPIDPPSSP